jgi:hypothetical protein
MANSYIHVRVNEADKEQFWNKRKDYYEKYK